MDADFVKANWVGNIFLLHFILINSNYFFLIFDYIMDIEAPFAISSLFYSKKLLFSTNFIIFWRKNNVSHEKPENPQTCLGGPRFQDFIKVSTSSTCFTAWTISLNSLSFEIFISQFFTFLFFIYLLSLHSTITYFYLFAGRIFAGLRKFFFIFSYYFIIFTLLIY